MKTTRLRLFSLAIAGLFGSIVLCACSGTSDTPAPAAPASAASAPAAPVMVTTVKAQKRDLAVRLNATGTVTPLTSVEVRAQVSSTVSAVHFTEGQFVKAGQLLFTLDARSDEANATKARAQLAKDQAGLADAKRQWERAKQLFAQNFISQGAVDTAQALVESLAATIAADQAAIDATRVALSFTHISAPLAGRAGAVNVSTGSAVQANQTTLVIITQLHPIGVAFNLPQRNLADALAALKDGCAPVNATLADGGGSFTGRLQFVDNAVDPSSGTVKVKAVFDNRDNKLWPGAFVTVSQTVATLKEAVVVPQAALIQSARGALLYVVQDGKALSRPVSLVYAEDGDAAVTGIQAGDSVVMDGRQNVRPNAAVLERGKEPKEPKTAASADKP